MTDVVVSIGEYSDSFVISNGMKQACVLVPIKINLFFTGVPTHAVRDIDHAVYLRYRLDGSLFDLRHLSVNAQTPERIFLDVLFAYDCVLMAHKESDLQLIVDKFAEASHLFGLTISLGKTACSWIQHPFSFNCLLKVQH